jgi:hypothetical protein
MTRCHYPDKPNLHCLPLCSTEISFITEWAEFLVGCIFKVLEADGQELVFSTHITVQEALVFCPSCDPEKVGINQKWYSHKK